MADVAEVLADLDEESAELDTLVSGIGAADWRRDTPSTGWTIADQIGHLAWTDEIARMAVTDPAGFRNVLQEIVAGYDGYLDRAAADRAALPIVELLERWRDGRAALARALADVPYGERLPWFGPPMSSTSMVTARLMETWAHGQDVADALGASRRASERLRHVAHIGVRTRDFAYAARDRTPPAQPFRVELTGPSGELWTWGPDDAAQQVAGPALDFCLLVTQRRHRDDLGVVAVGLEADEWLSIAQAFAGPPGAGRDKGQFG